VPRDFGSRDEWNDINAIAARVRSVVAKYLEAMRFGGHWTLFLNRIERLCAMIALWGARINLTAKPRDPGELAFHIIDSLSPVIFAESDELLRNAFGARTRVLDLGSGGGFPALVLASASAANFTLAERRRKRASFLAIAAAEMNLKNVTVESRAPGSPASSLDLSSVVPAGSSRASQTTTGIEFDAVTARAFASAPLFHAVAGSALKPGGIAILYANPGQELALSDAAGNGLNGFRLLPYTIPRGGRVVERILVLWQRQ
jgi:16S rRNA G527 N7-methylase RsmG